MPNWWDHQWEDITKDGPEHFLDPPRRKCKVCGIEQSLCEEHAWMRVISIAWFPKVKRRCPKAIKNDT